MTNNHKERASLADISKLNQQLQSLSQLTAEQSLKRNRRLSTAADRYLAVGSLMKMSDSLLLSPTTSADDDDETATSTEAFDDCASEMEESISKTSPMTTITLTINDVPQNTKNNQAGEESTTTTAAVIDFHHCPSHWTENDLLSAIKEWVKAQELQLQQVDFTKQLLESRRSCTLLHTAARLNYIQLMQYLIELQPELVDSHDQSQATPLFYACAAANVDAVRVLAMNAAQLNVHDSYEASPLSVSLNGKNKLDGFQVAKLLRDLHVDIEFKIYGSNTILHMACKEGDLDKVRFIVEELKHNIFRKDTREESILFRAVKHEHICKFLLQYCHAVIGHSKVYKLVAMKNDQKRTVIHHCCARGYLTSLLHIIDNMSQNEHEHQRLEELFNEGDGTFGLTPLHISILSNNEAIFSLLIRAREIQLEKQNAKGDTALHIAIRQHRLNYVQELYHLYSKSGLQLKNDQKRTIPQMAKEYDVDLKKLEKELEENNGGLEKESFWKSLLPNPMRRKKSGMSSVGKKSTMSHQEKNKRLSQKRASGNMNESANVAMESRSALINMSWDPSDYAVGNDLIDSEHAVLIGLLKDLSDVALTSDSHWVVGYVIGCCAEYTETHFRDEEEIMSKYKKGLGESYTKHLEQHEMFTQKIKQVHREYLKSHSASLDIELLNYLVDWLVKHINFTDRKLVEFTKTHQPDEANT